MFGKHSVTQWLRQPEYTGGNRCLSCTIVNVVLVILLTAVTAVVTSAAVALAIFLVCLTTIYLRGYVVPGTPTLTGYLPDRVLTLFDHQGPTTPGEQVSADPETVLLAAGAIEECETVDDLCLNAAFRTHWYDHMHDIKREASVWSLVRDAIDADDLAIQEAGEGIAVTDRERVVAHWPSRAAAIADFGAKRMLAQRYPEWERFDLAQQSAVVRGLRPFLAECPVCDQHVCAEKITSCCISGRAQTVIHCTQCEATIFESEPYTDLPA